MYYNKPVLELSKTAQTSLTNILNISDMELDDYSVRGLWRFVEMTPAPLLTGFKSWNGIGPCEVLWTLYMNAAITARIVDFFGKTQTEQDEHNLFVAASRGLMQCVYAAWLSVELNAQIELNRDVKVEGVEVGDVGFKVDLNKTRTTFTDIYTAFEQTWTGAAPAAFFDISRPFYEALARLDRAAPAVTLTHAMFRAIHTLRSDEDFQFRAYTNDKHADDRTRAWYLSRAQGASYLRKLIVEYMTKGMSGVLPKKPTRGLKLPGPRSLNQSELSELKKSVATTIERGRLPVDVFELEDKAQHLFNPDPFTEFRFWNCRITDDCENGEG